MYPLFMFMFGVNPSLTNECANSGLHPTGSWRDRLWFRPVKPHKLQVLVSFHCALMTICCFSCVTFDLSGGQECVTEATLHCVCDLYTLTSRLHTQEEW